MAYIGRADWDLAQLAIAVTGSAEVSRYGAERLITEDAAWPAKLSTTTGWWVLQFASPIAPAFAKLAYQYLDAGLTDVVIQAHTSNAWGAPAFEAEFTIPDKRKDGPSYQRWTRNPVLELGDLPDSGGYEWWRLYVGTANSQAITVGRLLLLSHLLRVQLLHVDGSAFDENDETVEITHPTDLQVESRIYNLGGPRRSLSCYVVGTDLDAGTAPVQEASDFRDIHETSQGREHPIVFLPFEDFSDSWLVRRESAGLMRAHRQGGFQVFPLAVREIARGLPWP